MGVTRIRAAGRPVSPWQLRIELLGDSHLHEFAINGRRYAEPDPEWNDELKQLNERGVVLDAALGGESRCFDYVYDFGDHWHHAVLVEDTFIQPQAAFAIHCIAGENACPPEDVGGAPGYAEFLAAIADPRHEEHKNYLAWCGGGFDPARFDREAVNRALANVRV